MLTHCPAVGREVVRFPSFFFHQNSSPIYPQPAAFSCLQFGISSSAFASGQLRACCLSNEQVRHFSPAA
jgi:hypothetical protein